MSDDKPGLEEVLRHLSGMHLEYHTFSCEVEGVRIGDLPRLIAEVVRDAKSAHRWALYQHPQATGPRETLSAVANTLEKTLDALAEHVEVSR